MYANGAFKPNIHNNAQKKSSGLVIKAELIF